ERGMNERLLRAYHRLPPGPRSMAASVWGVYLRLWRYGNDTDQLVAVALDREHWSPARLRAYDEDRLAALLHRAATRVPFYREMWAARRRKGDTASWERIENWPVLEKDSVRINPKAFVADSCQIDKM